MRKSRLRGGVTGPGPTTSRRWSQGLNLGSEIPSSVRQGAPLLGRRGSQRGLLRGGDLDLFIHAHLSNPAPPPRNRDTGQLTHILSPGPSTGPGAGQEDSVTLMKECVRGVHSGSSRDLTLGLVARFSCPLGQPTTSLALEHRVPAPWQGQLLRDQAEDGAAT